MKHITWTSLCKCRISIPAQGLNFISCTQETGDLPIHSFNSIIIFLWHADKFTHRSKVNECSTTTTAPLETHPITHSRRSKHIRTTAHTPKQVQTWTRTPTADRPGCWILQHGAGREPVSITFAPHHLWMTTQHCHSSDSLSVLLVCCHKSRDILLHPTSSWSKEKSRYVVCRICLNCRYD